MAELPGYPFNLSNADKAKVAFFIRDILEVCHKHNLALIHGAMDEYAIGSYYEKDNEKDDSELFSGILNLITYF